MTTTSSSNNHFLLFLCLLLCMHYAHSGNDDETKRCPRWIASKQKNVFEKCVREDEQLCGTITCSRLGKRNFSEEHFMGCVEEGFCLTGEAECSALTHDPKPQIMTCSVYGPYIGPISKGTDKPPLAVSKFTSPKGSVSKLTTQKSVPSTSVTETPKPSAPIVSTTMASGAGSAAIMFGIFLQAIVVAAASLFGVLIR
ncbi:hypothetical protein GPALN_013115 [Globodera pallida]|nr:hypothetical protein GPALN_013115 [Globodera pallida]